jgi:hypothetical protein
MIPRTFEEWRRCITVECGIGLTSAYVAERLKVLENERAPETVKFRKRYGDAHWRSVVAWFERARRETG